MNFRKSQPESENYQVNIYRVDGYLDRFEPNTLLEKIHLTRPDVVKLKVRADDASLFHNLALFPFLTDVHSFQYRNQAEVPESSIEYDLPSELSYKEASLKDEPLLRNMIFSILELNTDQKCKQVINYFSRDQYLKNTIDYLITFLSDTDSAIWIVFHEGQPAGFFSGKFIGDLFEGVQYGVQPQHRGRGISNHIYMLMLAICAQRGVKYFVNDIVMGNYGSTKSASKIGMTGTLYVHINIYPLLGIAGNPSGTRHLLSDPYSEYEELIEENEPQLVKTYGKFNASANRKVHFCVFPPVLLKVEQTEENEIIVGHRVSLWVQDQ